MSKNQWRFRPTELRRLCKALSAMGLKPCGVEVGIDGSLKVVVAETAAPSLLREGVQP
jgi:hypothetical protein